MAISDTYHNQQYLETMIRIHEEGEMIYNKRTGKGTKTIINVDHTYKLGFTEIKPGVYSFTIPLDTTRKSFWRPAVAEILCYLRGYRNAQDFRDMGAPTWDANANQNKDWLANPHRLGEDDIGEAYGVVGRAWPKVGGGTIDLLKKVTEDLSKGDDDRGETYTFYNPGQFHRGSLRPCMHSHQFSLLGKKLYVNSTQRSNDYLLGGNFNPVQAVVLLVSMGVATNNIPMEGYHKSVNVHFYEDQIPVMLESGHMLREPYPDPTMVMDTNLPHTAGKTGLDLLTSLDLRNFSVPDYQHHGAIAYPFSV